MSEAIAAEVVDESTGEMLPVPRHEDAITQFGDGHIGITRARAVAAELDGIIKAKGLSVRIGQSDHIKVEAWCACASMVGVAPRTQWTKRIPESGELEGYVARVEVVQIATGQVIGAAEAGCFTDEKQGSRQRWSDQHAVLSMAQTRATSKAIGQVLRWIPVLAGYSGTPAEEMPRDEQSSSTQQPRPNTPTAGRKASEKQTKMLYAVSMGRAQEIIDQCADDQSPLKHQDQQSLAGSIRKHAMAAFGFESKDDIKQQNVDALKHMIQHATVNADGETVVQPPAEGENTF